MSDKTKEMERRKFLRVGGAGLAAPTRQPVLVYANAAAAENHHSRT